MKNFSTIMAMCIYDKVVIENLKSSENHKFASDIKDTVALLMQIQNDDTSNKKKDALNRIKVLIY